MPVTVKIFTKHGGRPTLFQTREFEDLPVTIGRDAGCTVALEDPLKHISRVHVELEEQDGAYWMEVVSKVNPVLVKGRRYGPGTRLTLKSGDSFEMGEFEVQVMFPDPPAAPAPAAHEAEHPAGIPPPEPGIFDEPTYVGGSEPTYMGPAVKVPPPPPAAELTKPPRAPERRPGPDVTAPVPVAASMTVALRAFLDGAGLPQKDVGPAEAERLLRDSGAILRAAIEGLMMLLIARAEMRKEFQAEERTMVAARDNNPLKLMSDPNEAMTFLFDPPDKTGSFLDPVGAIGNACEDLRAHEIALMAGMRAAILGALRKFEPQALERALEKASGGFSLSSKKAKLWDLFLQHQEKLSHEAREDFNKVFGREFMSAYQAQVRKLKTGK
jgi:predicted component of type VI protein secretion system